MPCCYAEGELHPLDQWIIQYEEDAVDVDIAILDPHHHLWDPVNHDKDWPIPKCLIRSLYGCGPRKFNNILIQVNAMAKFSFGLKNPFSGYYMGEQLLADQKGRDGKGHKVVGTVYIESKWKTPGAEENVAPYEEAVMASEVNKQFPSLCTGIVAMADLRFGAKIEPLFQKYKQLPLVRGVRMNLMFDENKNFLQGECNKDTMSDASFREGFALLAKYGLTFDTCMYHTQIADLAALARAFPEQTIVMDHVGYPLGMGKYKMEETYPQWQAAMKDIAECKNVYCKVGGLGSRFAGFAFDERPKPPTSDELAEKWGPFVLFAIETFGVDRCMMESNFPVDKVSCSYTVLFNALKKIVKDYSVEDRQKLFELTARKAYSL